MSKDDYEWRKNLKHLKDATTHLDHVRVEGFPAMAIQRLENARTELNYCGKLLGISPKRKNK